MSFPLSEMFLPDPTNYLIIMPQISSSLLWEVSSDFLKPRVTGSDATLLSPTAPWRDIFCAADTVQSPLNVTFPKRFGALCGQLLHLHFSTSKPTCMLAQHLSKQLLSEKMSLWKWDPDGNMNVWTNVSLSDLLPLISSLSFDGCPLLILQIWDSGNILKIFKDIWQSKVRKRDKNLPTVFELMVWIFNGEAFNTMRF